MHLLTSVSNIEYFKAITKQEPRIYEAIDHDRGGCYLVADFGPILNNEIEDIEPSNSWEGQGYWVRNGVRLARLEWGHNVKYTAFPLDENQG